MIECLANIVAGTVVYRLWWYLHSTRRSVRLLLLLLLVLHLHPSDRSSQLSQLEMPGSLLFRRLIANTYRQFASINWIKSNVTHASCQMTKGAATWALASPPPPSPPPLAWWACFRVSRGRVGEPKPGQGVRPLQTAALCAHYCYCYYVMYLYALSGNRRALAESGWQGRAGQGVAGCWVLLWALGNRQIKPWQNPLNWHLVDTPKRRRLRLRMGMGCKCRRSMSSCSPSPSCSCIARRVPKRSCVKRPTMHISAISSFPFGLLSIYWMGWHSNATWPLQSHHANDDDVDNEHVAACSSSSSSWELLMLCIAMILARCGGSRHHYNIIDGL